MGSEDDLLTAAQVEDGFAHDEWDVDAQEEEEPRRERFRRWHAAEIAAAEKRGAERGWDELIDRIDGDVPYNPEDVYPNPYRADRTDEQ